MERLIFATGNEGKMREIRAILADTYPEILSMKEAGIQIDVAEDGKTYEENALIKARAVAAQVAGSMMGAGNTAVSAAPGNAMVSEAVASSDTAKASGDFTVSDAAMKETIVMADDSGLEIDFLNREPGVYSARYMGEDTSYRIKNANLISRLEGVPDEQRTARFVCAIAAVLPDGTARTVRAAIEGRIGYEEKGAGGFGYDPIFYVPELGKTTAELTGEEKNLVSHRGKALRLMKEELKKL